MTTLSKDQILAAQDRQTRELHVPAWGGVVRLRSLTAAEWEAFAQLCRERAAKGPGFDIRGIRARLLVLSIVDTLGNLVFGPEDLGALEGKASAVLELLWNECRQLNALSDEAIEEIRGN